MKEFYVGEEIITNEFLFALQHSNIIEVGDESIALVKYIDTNNILTFFVKECNDGKNKGRLFNPWDTLSMSNEIRRLNLVGKPLYTWRKVDKNVHDLYIKFLKTKNQGYLLNAERSL